MFEKIRKSRSGFTLLEILVVITLIIIIATIAIPRFAGVSDEGKKAKAAAELKTLQTALESYLLKTSPTTPADWATLVTTLESANPRLVGRVSDFIDPFTSNSNYSYKKSINNKYYVLFSIGANRTADITGITNTGNLTPDDPNDDIYVTNGQLVTPTP
jgi:type II secretion system protein G